MAKITKEVAELLFDSNKILIGESDVITLKDARLLTSRQAVESTMNYFIKSGILNWNCYCFGEKCKPVTYFSKKGFLTVCTYYNQELKELEELEILKRKVYEE